MKSSDQSDLIFDVGAHKGEDSDFYLKLGYRVVGVEANPVLAEHLRWRFSKEISEGAYRVVDRAISDFEGEITFYINKILSVWGTADPKCAKRNEVMGAESDEIKVKAARFSDLLHEHGIPYYVKVDIEGMDMLCVRALEGIEIQPKYVSMESTKTSWTDLLDEFALLEKLGYAKFKVVDQRRRRRGIASRKYIARNGLPIEYAFEEGATGPFGDDIEGPWLTKSEAIRRYRTIFILYRIMGDHSFLQKVLRRASGRVPVAQRILDAVLDVVSWYDTHASRE